MEAARRVSLPPTSKRELLRHETSQEPPENPKRRLMSALKETPAALSVNEHRGEGEGIPQTELLAAVGLRGDLPRSGAKCGTEEPFVS